jgi:hypothetical protein
MRIRPVGNGMIGGSWIGLSIHPGHVQVVTERVQSHHTVPYGTDAIGAFPGTSCQATFTLSLRDEIRLCTGQAAWRPTLLGYRLSTITPAGRSPSDSPAIVPLSSRFEFVAAQPPD